MIASSILNLVRALWDCRDRQHGLLVAHRVDPGIDREGRYRRVTRPPREIEGSAREAQCKVLWCRSIADWDAPRAAAS